MPSARGWLGVAAVGLAACGSGAIGDGPAATTAASTASSSSGGDGGAGGVGTTGSGGSGGAASSSSATGGNGGGGPTVVTATNPILGIDHPDPSVLRTIAPDGKPIYYLTSTSDSGDFPLLSSRDLIHWTQEPEGLFHRSAAPGNSIQINDAHYCHLWAPEVVELGPNSYLLSFTATRFATPQAPCPPYKEDSGVYLAWSSSPLGPFAPVDHPWEPIPGGAQISTCPADIRDQLPHAVDWASPDCQGNFCHKIMRLDSSVFRDPATGRYWMAYSWYTNSPPLVSWEHDNHGEHVELVELNAADPFAVPCDLGAPQIFAANPHDGATLAKLASYCPRCGEMLSMTRGRFGEEMIRDGHSWGVAEGSNLFRRDGWVYLLLSGSAWDSAYYHVYWVAAKTVEELAWDSPSRIAGRFLIPSLGQSFGHGQVVLGPDDQTLYYLHHRLDNGPCAAQGQCARDVWLSPMVFEDRGDGLGDVYLQPRFPAEDPSVSVTVL